MTDERSPPVDERDALDRLPPQVLDKAARPGRIRGIALDTWAAARASPRAAGRELREGVRQARALHSRERRLVREALYGMVRGHVRWTHVLDADDPVVLWLAQLVESGLPVERARELAPAPYERLEQASLPPALHHGLAPPIVAALVDAWGEGPTRAFLEASDSRAPVTLRANLAVVKSREAAAERLAREGIETVPGRHVPTSLHVVGRANLAASRAFRDGVVEVQDEGSQWLAEEVPAVARVWDMCAGAGGKSLALAARGMEVFATDVRGGALAEARRRARRACVELATARLEPEGALPDAVHAFGPEAVLVDAPCSGTGVLRRHPEHRWLLDEHSLVELPRLQGRILYRAVAGVPEGGVLVYGTCSVLPQENEDVVDAFLARHPDFERAGEPLRLAPHTHGTDGFFAQRLSRSHPLHSTARSAER